MPAPSPVNGSQPQAPRCTRLSRMETPFWTISCEVSPLMLATKPIPHESRSKRGSYNPEGGGYGMVLKTGASVAASDGRHQIGPRGDAPRKREYPRIAGSAMGSPEATMLARRGNGFPRRLSPAY